MNYRTRLATLVRLLAYGAFATMVAEGCSGDEPAANQPKPDGGVMASSGGNGGGTGGAGNGGAAPVDAGHKVLCTATTPECLGDRAMRICSPEGDWVTVPCGTNEKCSSGACATTQPCTPGEKKCATDGAAKVCDNDGSAYVVTLCGDGKICKAGDCVLDVKGAECNPGERQCVGTKTRLTCLAAGKGFESFDCPTDAPCSNGECRGSVCALGSTECSFDTQFRSVLRTCNADGSGFDEKVCGAGSTCQSTNVGGRFVAACTGPGACPQGGLRVCGNPTDPASDPTKSYSECRSPTGGALVWAPINCTAPATCDPANPGCTTTCLPGETRCSGTSAVQTCGADGTWGAVTQCNTSANSNLACRQQAGSILPDGGSKPPGAECVDRVCALLNTGIVSGGGGSSSDGGFGSGGKPGAGGFGGGFGGGPGLPTGPATGVCDGTQIRTCSPDGTLQAPADCKVGTCRAVSTGVIDGYHPGVCSNDCKAGESRCVSDGLPLYYTCGSDGTWSTTYQTCGSACTTATDSNGLRVALCGDSCIPGSTRCDGDKVQTCGSGKTWLPSVTCTVGRCSTLTGDAACLADCIPGGVVCAGDPKTASDGISTGTSASAVCTTQGTFPKTPTACTGTQACRVARSGEAVGCVECVGSSVPGGNDAGLVDSRCASSGSGVQTCNAQNAWAAATDCGQDQSCFIGRSMACGNCPGFFLTGTCTDRLFQQNFGSTCQNFGFGPSQQCGSTPDCCSSACNATGGAFAFCAPNDFSPCLSGSSAIDLGNQVPQNVEGTTLLGDDTFTPSCAPFIGSTPDSVYSFTAPAASTYAFDTFGSGIDTVLSVKDALACNDLGCNDNANFNNGESRVIIDLAAGQRVLVVVDARGDFTLNIHDVGKPGCGNGVVENSEQCDGNDFGGLDCFNATFGALPFGTLSCTIDCLIDTSGCVGGIDGGVGGFGGGFGGFGAVGGIPGAGGAIFGGFGGTISDGGVAPPPPGPSP